MSFTEIYAKSKHKIINGGLAGSSAAVVQVTSLLWLRTTLNYQYTNGISTSNALKNLYKQGGVRRFYRGYVPALVLASSARFTDTFANVGVLEMTKGTSMPLYAKTAMSSIIAGCSRSLLMPLDVIKTNYQVKGAKGFEIVRSNVKLNGPRVLWNGTAAQCTGTVVGHFPWFFTYNYLNQQYPRRESMYEELLKQGGIGFCSSLASDIFVNGFKVMKTTKQTTQPDASYKTIITDIIKKDGIFGIYRGFKTKLIINGVNGMVFSVCWKLMQDKYNS
jgi:hypothetical protein